MKILFSCAILLFISALFLAPDDLIASTKLLNNSKFKTGKAAFIENKGQIVDQHYKPNPGVLYLLNRPGMNVQLRKGGFSYDLYSPSPGGEGQGWGFHRIDFDLINANPNPTVISSDQSQDYTNNYTPGTPKEGVTFVRSYGTVTYKNIYPNIDLEFITNAPQEFKYSFIIRPGGDINLIQLQITDPEICLSSTNMLLLKTEMGTIEEQIPSCKYRSGNAEVEITGCFYKIKKNHYGFRLKDNVPEDATIVIDPTPHRVWGTYYGGDGSSCECTAVDPWGNILICGGTSSPEYVASTGSHQDTLGGGGDAYIAKFNTNGQREWGTYYGGTQYDYAWSCSSDRMGNIFMSGDTHSEENIATPGAFDTILDPFGGAFLVKFNSLGQRIWGTYYGGNNTVSGMSCATDYNCDVYLAGSAESDTGIATPGTYQQVYAGNTDAYVAKFDSTGHRLWGTYFGGQAGEGAFQCTSDSEGSVFLGGITLSTTRIASPGAFQTTKGGGFDGFFVRFTPEGQRYWSTYYGGLYDDFLSGVGLSKTGFVYISGSTHSPDSIASIGTFQQALDGPSDAFLAKFNMAGTRQWGTYYGGDGEEGSNSVAVDDSNYVFLMGTTSSSNVIATPDAFQTTMMGDYDCFITKFDSLGQRKWGTYYGDTSWDDARSIAVDRSDHIFLAGFSNSGENIATPGSFQDTFMGTFYDAFLVKFADCRLPDSAGAVSGPLNVCKNDTGIIYSISAVNYALGYHWTVPPGFQITSGQNTRLIRLSILNNAGSGNISVYATNICGNGDSAFLTVVVHDATVPVITGNDTLCQNSQATYSTQPGMTNYQWSKSVGGTIVAGGTPGSDFITIDWVAGGANWVQVIFTNASGCTDSLPSQLNVLVIPQLVVSVSITASANPVFTGIPVIFTATPVNGGVSPVFQWQVNGINVGVNTNSFTYLPVNGDCVTCTLTSSVPCPVENPVTSNMICMTVLPGSVQITADYCTPDGSVLLTTDPFQAYLWSTGASTQSITVYLPGIYTVSVFNNSVLIGTGSISISMLPPRVSVTASNNTPVCEGNTVNLAANPSGGTYPLAYTWSGPASFSSTLQNPVITNAVPGMTGFYHVTVTDAHGCTATDSTNVLVNSFPVPTISGPSSVCSNSTGNIYTTQSGMTNYTWSVSAGGIITAGSGTSAITVTWSTSGSKTISVNYSLNGCTAVSPTVYNVTVNPSLALDVSITASNNPVCSGIPVTFTSATMYGGPTPFYQWKVNGNNVGTNSSIYTYQPVNGDVVKCILTSGLPCTTNNPATSNTITMNIGALPVVSFTRCFDSITTTNAQPFKLKGGIPLNGTYSGAGVSGGVFHPAIAGVGLHQITYSYTNAAQCSASAQSTVRSLQPAVFSCGNILVDIRDNKTYATIPIGSQCWMASNLNFGTMIPANSSQRDNCIPEKYCPNDLTANCGLLTADYQWDEIMNYGISLADQGVCPPGWHVPSEADWNTLFTEYTNNGFAASPLKYSGFSGFNALLNGTLHLNEKWDYAGFATFFWSSTAVGSLKAWSHGMNEPDPSVSAYPGFRTNAFSVRCLKD